MTYFTHMTQCHETVYGWLSSNSKALALDWMSISHSIDPILYITKYEKWLLLKNEQWNDVIYILRKMRCPFPVHVDRETWTWNHQPKIIKNKWDNTLRMNKNHCFVWNWNKIVTLYKLQYFIDYLRFDIIHARLYEAFNKHTHMCIYYWNVLYIRT